MYITPPGWTLAQLQNITHCGNVWQKVLKQFPHSIPAVYLSQLHISINVCVHQELNVHIFNLCMADKQRHNTQWHTVTYSDTRWHTATHIMKHGNVHSGTHGDIRYHTWWHTEWPTDTHLPILHALKHITELLTNGQTNRPLEYNPGGWQCAGYHPMAQVSDTWSQ